MKSNSQKFIIIAIGLLLLALSFPNKAYAASSSFKITDDGLLKYTVVDKKAIILGPAVEGEISGDIVIPNKIDGYPVTKIAAFSFYFCNELSSVKLPETITIIDTFAFRNCSKLTKINLPKSLKTIGEAAFGGCVNLKKITLPNSLINIERGAFLNCTSLTQITIPNQITEIGTDVFASCTGLKQVNIPSSVTSIGNSAFCDCTSLAMLTLPNSLKTIKDGAFNQCKGLMKLTLPDSVTKIERFALANCSEITSIKLSKKLKTIGEYAFINCKSLKSIYLPNSIKTIGKGAFDYCINLSSVRMPDTDFVMKDEIFSNCTKLIPANFKGVSPSYNYINLSWEPVKDATGYEIYSVSSKRLLAYTTETTFTDTLHDSRTYFDYKVRAVKKNGSRNLYYSYSNEIMVMRVLSTPTNLLVNRTNSTSMMLTWDKVKEASGYMILKADSIDGEYSFVCNTTTTSYEITYLPENTSYYFLVRAFRNVSSTKVFSEDTKPVSSDTY